MNGVPNNRSYNINSAPPEGRYVEHHRARKYEKLLGGTSLGSRRQLKEYDILDAPMERSAAPLGRTRKRTKARQKQSTADDASRRMILQELPGAALNRIANIHKRHELLKANQAYNLRLERQRAMSALTRVGDRVQHQTVKTIIGDIDNQIARLAQRGTLPVDIDH